MSSRTAAAAEVVYRSSMALDDENFDEFLSLCDADFRYVVQAYSPEIRREMIWLDHDRAGIEGLFRNLPKHHSDRSPLTRHMTVYTVTESGSTGELAVVSALQVFRTSLDGGESALFAVGKAYDTVRLSGDRTLLARRTILLDTRMLGIGSHIIF